VIVAKDAVEWVEDFAKCQVAPAGIKIMREALEIPEGDECSHQNYELVESYCAVILVTYHFQCQDCNKEWIEDDGY
jgi:hypothetical protein